MSLPMKDLEQVIQLAHLHVEDAEKERYLSQLSKILDYMEHLNKLDLSHVSPTLHAAEEPTPLRADEVVAHENLMLSQNAPAWEAHCFRVPKILDA